MIHKTTFKAILSCLAFALLLASCKEDEPKPAIDAKDGTYFPIRQFAQDQWNTFLGEPFLIVKSVRVNDGKYDSSYTTSDTLNWGGIFDVFFATDISDPSFLGKYKYTQFPDDNDDTYNYFYQAIDEDVYTKKLLITANQQNNKIIGIYIEASEKSLFEDKLVKLYYKPMKRIQIQETVTPLLGEKKHTVTEYEFIR